MKNELEQKLLQLIQQEVELLVAGQMSDKERDWAVRVLATIQTGDKDDITTGYEEYSDEELMRIINENGYGSEAGSGVLEAGEPKLSNETQTAGAEIIPIGKTK